MTAAAFMDASGIAAGLFFLLVGATQLIRVSKVERADGVNASNQLTIVVACGLVALGIFFLAWVTFALSLRG